MTSFTIATTVGQRAKRTRGRSCVVPWRRTFAS
jgi:hypothetical protein